MSLKLRISTLSALVALCVAGMVGPALAAPLALPIASIEEHSVNYLGYVNTVAPAGTAPGFGIVDVTEDDGPLADAFDGAMHLSLNGAAFKDADGTVDVSPDPNVGGAGTTLTAAGKIGRLKITAKVGMYSNRETARVLYRIKNTSKKKKKVTVLYSHNLGSDGAADESVAETSDGDSALEANDSWFIADGGGDVVKGFGVGDRVSHVYPFAPGPGSGLVQNRFSFTIRPKKTVQLLFFHHFEQDLANAVAQTNDFQDVPTLQANNLLQGVSGKFFNWKPAP